MRRGSLVSGRSGLHWKGNWRKIFLLMTQATPGGKVRRAVSLQGEAGTAGGAIGARGRERRKKRSRNTSRRGQQVEVKEHEEEEG